MAEKRSHTSNDDPANDSFDEYEPIKNESAWMYSNVSVKNKSARKSLWGFPVLIVIPITKVWI